MTTALATRPAARARLRPRGVTWLTWRQSRAVLLVVALGFVAGLACLLYQRHQFDVTATRMRVLHCAPPGQGGPFSDACDQAGLAVMREAGELHRLATVALALPGLLGAVLAAQPLAADFERGRHLLLWSQSVSPRRWFTQRMLLPATVLLVLSTVLSAALRWAVFWSHPVPSLDYWNSAFAVQVMVPAYPALVVTAFAVGALVGLLLHRVIPALGVTLGLYAALVYGLDRLSPFLQPLYRMVLPPGVEAPMGAWVYDSGAVWHGREIPFSQCPDTGCVGAPTWMSYHPVSQLGPMLWIETGILAALTAVLVALAFRRLRALTH